MKKILTAMIMAIAISMCMSIPAMAGTKTHTCGYNGCTASTDGCDNGTVYCDRHAAQYAKEKEYQTCAYAGCYKRVSGTTYCSAHTCHASKCNNRVMNGGRYCSEHSCKVAGCNGSPYDSDGYCYEHYKSRKSSSSSSSKKKTSSSSSKKTNSSNKIEWPDCDDYEDEDDFLDDWDGEMPGGSDAEDYWDNW